MPKSSLEEDLQLFAPVIIEPHPSKAPSEHPTPHTDCGYPRTDCSTPTTDTHAPTAPRSNTLSDLWPPQRPPIGMTDLPSAIKETNQVLEKQTFEKLYQSVASGEEARITLEANSRPDYRTQLEKELAEIAESEMWKAGAQVRSLRPERS